MAEKEYIEREALLKSDDWQSLKSDFDKARAHIIILGQPAPDVVEVVHARFEWGYQNGQYGIWCTNCGAGWVNSENAEWIAQEHNYCPKCGAKMDDERGVKQNE